MPYGPPHIKARYTRSDSKGHFPRLIGPPEPDHNRLAVFWRPIIDLTDSQLAPMRLRLARPVAAWLAEPSAAPWSWFAMMGVAGLRHQVIRHAGLDRYDSREPTDLRPELRTPSWTTLVEAIEQFAALDNRIRALVVFQLAQLSYCEFVFKLAGVVVPNGDPAHDRYAYEVARAHARYPGRAAVALPVFARLATSSGDRLLALMACFQGISHTIRSASDLRLARGFEESARRIITSAEFRDDWYGCLVRSRFHRALALLRMVERRPEDMRRELETALKLDEELFTQLADEIDELVALENRRILVEAQIKAACRDRAYRAAVDVRALCEKLIAIDPYCVQVRLVVGDGYAAIGDYPAAALWYSRAGELGTSDGAFGWFRAAQCHDLLGDRWSAVNAMGRCLELDTTAVEPREYLAAVRHLVREQAAPSDDRLVTVSG